MQVPDATELLGIVFAQFAVYPQFQKAVFAAPGVYIPIQSVVVWVGVEKVTVVELPATTLVGLADKLAVGGGGGGVVAGASAW